MRIAAEGREDSERKRTTGKVLVPLQSLRGRNGGTEDFVNESFQQTSSLINNNKANLQRSREATSRSMALESGIFSEERINFETMRRPPVDALFKPSLNLKRGGVGGGEHATKIQESGIFKIQNNSLLNSTLSLNPKALLEKKQKLYVLDKPSNQGLMNDEVNDDKILTINEVLSLDFFPIVNESVANSRNPQVFKKLFLQKISKTVKF